MTSPLKTSGTKVVASPSRGTTKPLHRILVIEDDAIIRKLNARVLAHSGYHVDAAENGAVGWKALRANNFDLLITDHDMPKLSGLELVKKARSAHMTLPIILATGTLPEEELGRHPSLQITATLLKPFSSDQLLETVKKILHPAYRAAIASNAQAPSTTAFQPVRGLVAR